MQHALILVKQIGKRTYISEKFLSYRLLLKLITGTVCSVRFVFFVTRFQFFNINTKGTNHCKSSLNMVLLANLDCTCL